MNGVPTVGPSREGWTILDPAIALRIQEVYDFSEDLIIGIATDVIKREAFHGGIAYVMAEQGQEPREFDTSEVWVEHTMKKALDFYYQYGMCPFMRSDHGLAAQVNEASKKAGRPIKPEGSTQRIDSALTASEAGVSGSLPATSGSQSGNRGKNSSKVIKRFLIPSIQSGNFLARMTFDGQIEVGFQLHRFAGSHRPASQFGREVAPTPGVHVFVWPGRTPVPTSSTPFRSLVYRLLPTQLSMREFWRNDLDASHTGAHPSLLLVRTGGATGFGEQMSQETELSVYADALAVAGPSTMEHQRDTRKDTELVTRLQQQLRRMRETSGGGTPRLGVDSRLVGAQIYRYQNWQEGNVFIPPAGLNTATPPVPQRETDIIHRIEWWERMVSLQFGVPAQFLGRSPSVGRGSQSSGGSTASTIAGVAGSQSEACTMMRKTVQGARDIMSKFFEASYSMLFRDEDTDRLASRIIANRKRDTERRETLDQYERHVSGRLGALQTAMIERQQQEILWNEEERRLRTVINRVFNMTMERTSMALDSNLIGRFARQELERERSETNRLKSEVLPVKTRLRIYWNQPILADLITLNYMEEKGYIHEDIMRQIVLREQGLPQDTPKGTRIEERTILMEKRLGVAVTNTNGGGGGGGAGGVKNTTRSQTQKVTQGKRPRSEETKKKKKGKEKEGEKKSKKQKTGT